MNVKYDKIADAVYVSVGSGKVAKTVKTNDRFLTDVDASGKVVGFEILDASSQEGLISSLTENVRSGVPISIVSGTPVAV